MSAGRSEVVPNQHWSLLLRSARCSPFRLRPNDGHDVGRNRSCSAVLPQHFIHVLPGREHFSEVSTTTCASRLHNISMLNRIKSKIVNSCTTAECYESTFRLPAARNSSPHVRPDAKPATQGSGGGGSSPSGHLSRITRTGASMLNKSSILRRPTAVAEPLNGRSRVADGAASERPASTDRTVGSARGLDNSIGLDQLIGQR